MGVWPTITDLGTGTWRSFCHCFQGWGGVFQFSLEKYIRQEQATIPPSYGAGHPESASGVGGGRSQETQLPDSDVFEPPNQAGLEASLIVNIFKYLSQLMSFFFLRSLWIKFSFTYSQKSTTSCSSNSILSPVYRCGIWAPGWCDFPKPFSFKLRSVSLQGWSVLPLRNHLPVSIPRWPCPKVGAKLRHLGTEGESAILLAPRPKTLVEWRQEEKEHFLEQLNFWTWYLQLAISELVTATSVGYLFDHTWLWKQQLWFGFPVTWMNCIIRQLVEVFLITRNKKKNLNTPPSPSNILCTTRLARPRTSSWKCVTNKIPKRQKSLMETVLLSASVTKISSKGVLSILLSYIVHLYMTSISSTIAFELAIKF